MESQEQRTIFIEVSFALALSVLLAVLCRGVATQPRSLQALTYARLLGLCCVTTGMDGVCGPNQHCLVRYHAFQVQRTLAGGFLFGVQFEPHTQGGDVGMGGAGSVAKRKRGEGMDTEAVQTTLQAMRIQVGEDKMLGRGCAL